VKRLIELGFFGLAAASAAAHPTRHRDLWLMEKANQLRPGQYIWDARAVSAGYVFLVINLSAKRVLVYRNRMLIAASTVSTGGEGRRTPTGFFTILQKEVVHRSRTYDDAPMPYMQRLTWKGVAIHAGHVSAHAASHGCIRLPRGFAIRLYRVTKLGTPVIITA
jgi:lipoprotein-anchoring transpeptidase ErfK/SrfK